MTLRIDVRSDTRQLSRRLKRRGNLANAIMKDAINRTGQQVKTTAIRHTAEEAGLAQSKVRPEMKLVKAGLSSLEAIVIGSGRVLNLASFKARQTKKGVSAAPWGKRRLWRSAFLLDGKTALRRKTKKRLPLKALYGASIPRVMRGADVLREINRTIRKRWPINVAQQIRRRFK